MALPLVCEATVGHGFIANCSLAYPLSDLGLDSTFVGAWGTVPLSRHSSKLMRLVRASDSAELDISRAATRADDSAIRGFLSGTTGKVTTLYDQVSSNDAAQSTDASRPGLEWHLGFPTAYGLGGNFTLPSAPTITGQNFSIYFVWVSDGRTSCVSTSIPGDIPGMQFDSDKFSYPESDHDTTPPKWTFIWGSGASAYPMGVGGDCSINVGVVRSTPSLSRYRVNDFTADSVAHSATSGAATKLLNLATGSKLLACLISTLHTADQEQQVLNSLKQIVATQKFSKLVVFAGDSITGGAQTTDFLDHRDLSWPYQMIQQIGDKSVLGINRAVSCMAIVYTGTPARDMTYRAAAMIDSQLSSVYSGKILVVFAGSNDISNGDSGATAYGNLVTYCQARKAAGWGKLLVITCIPRTDFDAGKEAERLDFNSRILANGNTDWDATVDVAALNWKPGGSSDWTTNYQDGIHPNASGRTLIANAVQPTLQGFL